MRIVARCRTVCRDFVFGQRSFVGHGRLVVEHQCLRPSSKGNAPVHPCIRVVGGRDGFKDVTVEDTSAHKNLDIYPEHLQLLYLGLELCTQGTVPTPGWLNGTRCLGDTRHSGVGIRRRPWCVALVWFVLADGIARTDVVDAFHLSAYDTALFDVAHTPCVHPAIGDIFLCLTVGDSRQKHKRQDCNYGSTFHITI